MARRGRPRYKSGWRKENGVYYFSVTSNGMTAEEWVSHFDKKGLSIEEYFKETVLAQEFLPTTGNVSEVAILDDSCLGPEDKYMKDVRRVAKSRGLVPLVSPEVICLVADYIIRYRRDDWWRIKIDTTSPIYNKDGDLGFLGLVGEEGDILGFDPETEISDGCSLQGCGIGYPFSVASK